MEKINLTELLRDCPSGMELDCTCADNVVFDKIIEYEQIKCVIGECHDPLILDKYGRLLHICCPKCVIFPKGKTTWEGFVPPIEFKDGDVIFTHSNCLKVGLGNTWISIFQEKRNGGVATYVDMSEDGEDYYDYIIDGDNALLCMDKDIMRQRFATEEEKQKLFDAIKANGYKWNPKTKTLEKLPKFKVGDRVRSIYNNFQYDIKELTDTHYTLVEVENKFKYTEHIIEDKNWELVPSKFDITTLVPFEDKVLVRNDESQRWLPAFWGYKVVDGFITTFGWCKYCIPYKGNEILFKTNNGCDDFYKTWEE